MRAQFTEELRADAEKIHGIDIEREITNAMEAVIDEKKAKKGLIIFNVDVGNMPRSKANELLEKQKTIIMDKNPRMDEYDLLFIGRTDHTGATMEVLIY